MNGMYLIFLYASPDGWFNYESDTRIAIVEDWWNNNGIVSLCWHWNVPLSQGSTSFSFSTDKTKPVNTTFDITKAVVEGTWETRL